MEKVKASGMFPADWGGGGDSAYPLFIAFHKMDLAYVKALQKLIYQYYQIL